MSKQKPSDLEQVRKRVFAEVDQDAPILAQKLFGNREDVTPMGQQQYLLYARTMWNSGPDMGAAFRERLRLRVGDKTFLETAAQVHGVPAPIYKKNEQGMEYPDWQDPLAGLPMTTPQDMLDAQQLTVGGADAATG